MTERANPSVLHRRVSDPPEEDFRKSRRYEEREVILEKTQDSLTKWVVGVVGAGIITLLGVLALRDRQSVDQTLVHLDGRLVTTQSQVARHEVDIARLETQLIRIPEDIAAMRKQIDQTNEKLDRVLIEIRRQR
jgi:hypothetical protein